MGGNFSADTDGIDKNAPYMRELGDRIDEQNQQLQAIVAVLWGCWGDDATGKQFEKVFAPAARAFHEAIRGITGLFSGTSDGIKAMSNAYADMEHGNIEAAHKLLTPSPADGPSPRSGHTV